MDAKHGPPGRRERLSAEDLERVERYLTGDLTPPEAEAFAQWLRGDLDRARVVDALAELWNGDGPYAPRFDTQAMWQRLLPRVREHRRNLRLHRGPSGPSHGRTWQARMPAIVAACALCAAALTIWVDTTRARSQPHDRSRPMREFATRRGERADLRLDDGSQIMLGAETTIRIPNDFGDRSRDVFLDGEAYFVVQHDRKRPFAVHAGRTTVRDVGTRFAVTAYGAAAPAQIVVAEGEVSVAHVELGPGDLAIVDSSGRSATVHHGVNASAAIDWTQGRLTFDGVPFAEVATSLGRWYDLDIQLADTALAHQQLTVTFGSESLHQVLDAIALLTHTRYEQRGRTTTFYTRP